MDDFKFVIPLQKEGSKLIGIASTTSVDRDEERMSDEALQMMVDGIKEKGVNLFGNHEHQWENILGGINNASLVNKEVQIQINPNLSNPKYNQLIGTINTPGVRVGLSVGGNVMSYKWEHNKSLNKRIKVLDKVQIYEVSVVGIPSNADSFVTIPEAIAKSANLSKADYGQCPNCGGDFVLYNSGDGDVRCKDCGYTTYKKCFNCYSITKGVCELCLTKN